MAIERVTVADDVSDDPLGSAFWQGVAAERLLLRRCDTCGYTSVLPIPGCALCGSTEHRVLTARGTGVVYSWVVCHRAMDPAFVDEVPYTVLAVTLDEGARLFGRLSEPSGARSALEPGLGVSLVWPGSTSEVWAFELRREASQPA